jgi:hypothetical protein
MTDTEGRKMSPLSKEEEGRSRVDEEAPESHCDSEEEPGSVIGDEDRLEGEARRGTPPPLSTEEDQVRPSRRGRPKLRMRGKGRVREAERHLTSRSYSSYTKVQRDIASLTHLGPV